MTLNEYREHVEHLKREVTRAKYYADTTGQVMYIDWHNRAKAKAMAAERYLRRREAKECAA